MSTRLKAATTTAVLCFAAGRRTAGWLVLASVLLLSGCAKMQLMKAMLQTNEPNERTLAQMFAWGGGGTAKEGADGIPTIDVYHKPGETIWRPAVIMVDRPGPLEIRFHNEDPQGHLLAVVPSDGGMQALDLPVSSSGIVRVHLGTPGLYMFGDAMGNHLGRGMMGMILVGGEVPQHAKLDRPKQPRP
jgi:PQQ system protein